MVQAGSDPAPRSQLVGAAGVIGEGFRTSRAADEDGQEAGCHRQSRRRKDTLRSFQLKLIEVKLTGFKYEYNVEERKKTKERGKVALAASTESTNIICLVFFH